MTDPAIHMPEPPLFRQEMQVQHLPTNPPEMLAHAVVNGDAETIKILSDMCEHWQDREAEKAFNIALLACQKEMPSVVRDAKNTQTGSMYATLESVDKVARPIYTKFGFAPSFGEADSPLPNHKRTICDLRHDAGHTEHYHLDLPVDGIGPKGNPIGGMNAVQGCISTTSYGQRRLLCMMFNIRVAGEDDDGQGATLAIDDEQIAMLREWFVSSGEGEGPTLKWCQVKSVAEIPAKKLPVIIERFHRKYGNANR